MQIAEPRDIFHEALDFQSAPERAAFLDRACAGDPSVRREVDALLKAHFAAGGFLECPSDSTPFTPLAEGPGVVIGRYKLLEKIGEGGFGVVYLAEQREPVKRRTALKIIKLGMDTRQVVARFEAERQALALMDHPNIARVLDGGATDAGRPYFVMELVRGVPITQFCDDHSRGIEERLRLFIEVCHAIQHAHQKGIIHRDIKPSNVLVTHDGERPVAKVIDFGVAKATQQELTEQTIHTRFHEFIGTPAYMSPEQARGGGLDIDTRSDIYALGVLLCELLAGKPPFDSRELLDAGPDEMRRRIQQEEPLKPSARLLTLPKEEREEIARYRHATPERLHKTLRGELDWIILKCLEKDRSRRYESAAALAQDVERYLQHEPVLAAAPGVWYRARKFTQRHRSMVWGGVILAGFLAAAALVSTYFAIRATQAERKARQEAAIAEAVSRFVNEDFFGQADPSRSPDPELRVRTSLDRAAAQIQHRFAGQPLVEAAVHATIGALYSKLSDDAAAERHLDRAIELRFHELGEQNVQTAEVMMELALVLLRTRRLDNAKDLGQRAYRAVLDLHGPRHPRTYEFQGRMAWIHYFVGESSEAFELAREVDRAARESRNVNTLDHAHVLQLIARSEGRQGRRADGEAAFRQALAMVVRDHGEHHPRASSIRVNFAGYFIDHNYNLAEAEDLLLLELDRQSRVYGQSHYRTVNIHGNLVILYRRLNRPAEAAMHQIALLEHGGASIRPVDIAAVPPLLRQAGLKSWLGENPPWRATRAVPLSTWNLADFDDAAWEQTPPGGPVFWCRSRFQLERVPEISPILVFSGDGEFEAYLNGYRIPRAHFHKEKGFQIVILDADALRALRPGTNLLAIQGRSAAETGVTIDLLERFRIPAQVRNNP